MHVFKSAEEITLLFQVLNKLHEIGCPHGESAENQDQKKDFLETAFGVVDEMPVEVRLHFTGREGNESRVGDLFRLLCEGKLERRHQVLVYYLLLRLVKYNEEATDANLRDFLRVVRNFLYSIRKTEKMAFNSGIELKELSGYAKYLDEVLGEKEVYAGLSSKEISEGTFQNMSAFRHEVEKAKWICAHPAEKTALFQLEEHDLLRGFLRNLPWQDGSGIDINKLRDAFFAIFGSQTEKVSDKLVARALVACGFRGILNKGIKNYTWWAYSFGGNESRWRFVLTYPLDKRNNDTTGRQTLCEALQELFKQYIDKQYIEQSCTPEERLQAKERRLQAIIDEFLAQAKNSEKTPWYYLVKYAELWSGNIYHFAFSFGGNKVTFERKLNDRVDRPLASLHWKPFVFMVRKHLEKLTEPKDGKNFPIYERYENDAKSRKFALYLSNHEWNLAIPLTKEEQEDQALRDKHDLAKEIRALLSDFILEDYDPHNKEYDIRYIIRPQASDASPDMVEFGISIAEKLIALI